MGPNFAAGARAGLGAAVLAAGIAATAKPLIATPLLLVNGVGWTVAHNVTTGTSPVDGALLLDGGGASLIALFHNLVPALVPAAAHILAPPTLAPLLAVFACLLLSAVGYGALGAQRGMPWVGALCGVSVTVLSALATGRIADALGGAAALWLVAEGRAGARWARRLGGWVALAAVTMVAPWPTVGVLAAAGRERPAALALGLGVLLPPLGGLGHVATPGVIGAGDLFWLAGGATLPVSLACWILVLALVGTPGWRGWGVGLGLALLAGLSPPSIDGRVIFGLPVPEGEGITMAAVAAAPVVGLRFLASRAQRQVRALVALALVAELVALRATGQLPGLPAASAWPQSEAMADLGASPGRSALSVYPATAPETVGWLPWHQQAVRGLPEGVGGKAGRRAVGPSRRGALWVRPSPAEASLLATELGKPSAIERDLVLWMLP